MYQTECVRILRHMIDDLSTTPTYTDDRLIELIIVSAQFVNQEVSLTAEYTVDLDELTLSPDPTERNSRDDSFINLICLKAACMIDQAEARRAASKGYAIRDGGTFIDSRSVVAGTLDIWKNNWCEAYRKAKMEYEIDRVSVAGQAILSPFKTDNHYFNTDLPDFR